MGRQSKGLSVPQLIIIILLGSLPLIWIYGLIVNRDVVRVPDYSTNAQVACQQAIRQQLVAPATSEFDSGNRPNITHSGDKYTVAGKVDSENGFGALLRSDYHCELTASEQGDMTLDAANVIE